MASKLRDAGHEVLGLVRSDEKARLVKVHGIEPIVGTLNDTAILQDAARRARLVAKGPLAQRNSRRPKQWEFSKMKPTLVKDRTHCAKGHDLRIHGYYFGSNQRCRACNRRGIRDEPSGAKNQISEGRTGYSIGAAGVGTDLLHSSLAQKGQDGAILFPDNPFPSARGEIAKGASTSRDVDDLVPFLP